MLIKLNEVIEGDIIVVRCWGEKDILFFKAINIKDKLYVEFVNHQRKMEKELNIKIVDKSEYKIGDIAFEIIYPFCDNKVKRELAHNYFLNTITDEKNVIGLVYRSKNKR